MTGCLARLYQREREGIVQTTGELEEVERQLAEAYGRWETLEELK